MLGFQREITPLRLDSYVPKNFVDSLLDARSTSAGGKTAHQRPRRVATLQEFETLSVNNVDKQSASLEAVRVFRAGVGILRFVVQSTEINSPDLLSLVCPSATLTKTAPFEQSGY